MSVGLTFIAYAQDVMSVGMTSYAYALDVMSVGMPSFVISQDVILTTYTGSYFRHAIASINAQLASAWFKAVVTAGLGQLWAHGASPLSWVPSPP